MTRWWLAQEFEPAAYDFLGGSQPAEELKAEDRRVRSDQGRQGGDRLPGAGRRSAVSTNEIAIRGGELLA